MMVPYNCSLYGNYRQVKFTDVYGDADSFVNDYNTCGIPASLTDANNVTTLYYLLYAKYGNSTIASSDTTQFKYKLFSIIFSYGPSWEKRLEIQEDIRGLTQDQLVVGSTQIYNHSYNPSTAPSTSTLEELTTINEQNTTKGKRGLLDAYSFLWDLIDTDVTTEFLNRFASLFIKIVEPELPLWYATPVIEDYIIGDGEGDGN